MKNPFYLILHNSTVEITTDAAKANRIKDKTNGVISQSMEIPQINKDGKIIVIHEDIADEEILGKKNSFLQ
ncbi:MAG TPA: hypothetical protein VFF49_06700 [Thermodesulfobacteriota bacterium]|nr:hypothetical protein [Thermodesulfobacteriota bacterium]